jgi:lysophospholipase L1-like esterase
VIFWNGTALAGDPLCFVDRRDGEVRASLLFPAERGLSLRSAAGDVEYEEGRDFRLDAAVGVVILTAASRIPTTRLDELYPRVDPDGSGFMFKRGEPDTFLLFAEGDVFHRRQVRADYGHARDAWRGAVPPFRGADLPRTQRRLRAGDPLTIAVTGDSISEGYNASGFVGVPPYQPPYVTLVANGLSEAHGSPIEMRNFASAGWTSDNGLADAARVGAAHPDLVIVAFGMNDSGYAEAADFAANITAIVGDVRGGAPDAEFVLVSPMLPNPEWHYPVTERFAAYRDALAARCGDGVVLADVTTVWTDLLARKSVYDLTGNGINHPNDFGHRVYADVLLATVSDRAGRR